MAKASVGDIAAAILEELPGDCSSVGNGRLRKQIAAWLGAEVSDGDYLAARDTLVQQGLAATGKGRGGSLRRILEAPAAFSPEVPHDTLKSIASNPEIDEIYERMHPAIEQVLQDLNELLKDAAQDFHIPWFTIQEGHRKGEKIDFQAGNELLEWEVPFELPEEWLPEDVRQWNETSAPGQERDFTGVEQAFEAFHAARQAMQRKMDESIAAVRGRATQPSCSKAASGSSGT